MSDRTRRHIPGTPASSPARAHGHQLAGNLVPAGGSVANSEFLILSDGTVLAHNLTPAMADVLRALNPKDPIMSRRALCRS